MKVEDGFDRWPTSELSPTDYERAVARLVRDADHEVADWHVQHLDSVEGTDGTYIIDVTVRFRLLGADFLMLFECKRHASPVKREDVQVLKDKRDSTGAQKGVVVATSGFQRGALEYAQTHKIACVRLVDGAWTYITRDLRGVIPQPTGDYTAYGRCLTVSGGYSNTMLSGQHDRTRSLLFDAYEDAM
ncbi:MAG: restriction endonuclease [Pseudonocardiaceae bacterium]